MGEVWGLNLSPCWHLPSPQPQCPHHRGAAGRNSSIQQGDRQGCAPSQSEEAEHTGPATPR